SDVSDEEREIGEDAILRFSLAGVQLKFSAIKENTGGLTIPVNGMGGSWIVKLPSTKFNGVPENEFAMMELARRVGMDVPETTLMPLNQIAGLPKEVDSLGGDGLAIKRFDRADEGTPVHIEDFAQIFGVYPEKKYARASYRNIAEVIWAETGEPGIAEFIRRIVFNALIGNGDMHLKNWSLIYPDRRKPALAPAYDFVSTIPYMKEEKLALTFVDSKEFESLDLDQFDRFAGKAGLPRNLVLKTAQETVELFAEKWNSADDLPIKEEIQIAINTHLERIPLWKNKAHFD
ncbi:MAG: HipA domain-containing protein, partial [Nitrospinaceae bacterium]|nr:HipA domain-containing protein [Nitrospinaceae bacterium]